MMGNRKGKGQGPYFFTRGQLVLLAAGFTLTSVVVFLLGVLIGKAIEERKLLKKEEPLVKIPVQPLIPGSRTGAPPKEEMTFYDTLAKARTSAKPDKENKPVEKETRTETKQTQAAKQTVPPASKEVKEKSVGEVRKEAPAEKVSQAPSMKADTTKREGDWTVQVNAYPHEKDAKELAKKLKDKGFDSYVVATNVKGRPWYRVRVGHFETREQAQELQETLKQKENLTQSMSVSR